MSTVSHRSPVISIKNNCGNFTDSYNNVWNNCDISVADEKRQILEWLSPLDPRGRHRAIGIGRVAGVGDWLLHTTEFIQWHGSSEEAVKPVLFCYGNPGVGKTLLSSLVIDRLCDRVDGDGVAVTCAYCDFQAQNEQSTTELLGSLLRQAVSALEPVPGEVQRAFESAKGRLGGRRLLLPEILGMLVKSLSSLQKVFICIDALDEFPVKNRSELWESLQQIVGKCPNTRLFLTGRLHILEEVRKYFHMTAEMLPISTTEDDIGLYLRMRLKRDSDLDAMDEELKSDILRIIPVAVSGIFLLVSLNMDSILAETTIHRRRQALYRVTNGLGLQDAYNTTLDRMRQQGGSKWRLGMQVLMWISHCGRPLRSEELCHALGVELGTDDINTYNVPSIRTVLGCTLGLVTIDGKESTARLLHLTLHEFLESDPTLFITPHSMMAEIWLTYLNSRSVRALPPNLGRAQAATPLLEYATCFWGAHAAGGVTEGVESLALRLLDGYENHTSAAILWGKKIRKWYFVKNIQGISGLHCIAFWGIVEIAITMLGMKRWNVNSRDSRGDTPLAWAIKYRNYLIVDLFLEQEDIKPDMVIQNGRTVFSFSAESGNELAVKLLLECGRVDPDSSDSSARTPLSFAASRGHEGVVKLLLQRTDISPDSSDSGGRTPLSFAASEGHEGVVRLFLECGDVNPDSSDGNGRTPLSYAAMWGDAGVVRLLLERGNVNPDSLDKNGRTPLSFAASKGHEGVVKLLLEHGSVNPNSSDNGGRTPLTYAASRGDEGVVKLLLGCAGAEPNSSDNNGRTPLSLAVSRGHGGVVKLLLQSGDANPDLPDIHGRTPLSFAAMNGREGLVKLLLEGGDVDPNSLDNDGRTPLSLAVSRGHEGIVQVLLRCGAVNPDSPDRRERTPLPLDANGGAQSVAYLLPESRYVSPSSFDNSNRTPPPLAVPREHEGVVKELRGGGDVNPNLSDNGGRTLLSSATRYGVLKKLSGYGSPDSGSFEPSRPITASCRCEDTPEREATDPLLVSEGVIPCIVGGLTPGTPISRSVSLRPPQEPPLPREQSPLCQLDSSSATPTPGFSVGFPFSLLTFVHLLTLIFLAFLTYFGHGDSSELFHAIHGAWR